MDFSDILVRLFLLVLLAGVVVAIFWPLDSDDVMQRVHGDQPRLPQ